MGRTACTEYQCLYKGDLYVFPFFLIANKMEKEEVGWVGMDRSDLGQNKERSHALVNAGMNFRV